MRKNKEIHAVVKYFYPVAAGIETNMLETYSVLVQEGWQVYIHTTKDTLTEKNKLKKKDSYRGINIVRYGWGKLGFLPKFSYEQVDVIALHNFNIVPHLYVMMVVLIRKSMQLEVPALVLTPHGGFTPDWEIFPLHIRCLKWLYHRTLGAFLINLTVQGIRAVSEWEKGELMRSGIKKELITVIPNGIEREGLALDNRKVSLKIKKFTKKIGTYIIQIGRIYNIKNYETPIKALVSLPKKIHYVIAGPIGDYHYYNLLKKLIVEYGLTDRVHFVGVIRGYDKYYLIRSSLLMVHMARWESFCNVVHEAMSQGKVVIVADNTALRYLVEDGSNGYKVATHDSIKLADTIAYVLRNKSKSEIKNIEITNKKITSSQSWANVAIKINTWLNKKIL